MLGMPRIEIEFEFDMVFCFGTRLALFAVFSTRIYRQHIARPVESVRPTNIIFVCPSVRLSIRSFFRCRAITLQPLVTDLSKFRI